METLQTNGHTVGFLGDGLNDLPAVIRADVGISVENATEAVRESANVILLKKDLNVLEEGVLEGREAFANMLKYIKITASSNFGNICAIVAASVLLPFFPMTSIQLLLLNLLYDILCLILPWDHVDADLLTKPLEWSGRTLGKFMTFLDRFSSLFDLLTFCVFVFCSLSGSVRRLFWKSFGGEAELVYFHVSDRVVFRIHVDTGIDSAASAYKTASADTKQTGAYGHGSYDSGDCIIYTAAGYSGREDAWNDCDASCLFSVFGRRCDCVSSVGHTGKSILYQKESGSDLRKEEPEYRKKILVM